MKAVTPVRLSRSGRPNTAGDDVPVTASMELLPPEAASSPSLSGLTGAAGQAPWSGNDVVALGGPASLHHGSRPTSVRRSASAHHREGVPTAVVQLTSTRASVDTTCSQGQGVGMLTQQLPGSSALLQSQSLALRSSSNRYSNSNNNPGGTVPSNRPSSAASSTTSSMLVGGVPSPLPTHTPATLSRLWTPEECGSEIDDSANTRAVTASTIGSQAVRGELDRVARGTQDGLEVQGSYNTQDADFYRYLESRRATEESGINDHAFTVPDYCSLDQQSAASSRQPMHAQQHSRGSRQRRATDDTDSQVPGTPQSVASGVMGGSGIFFTALRRSLAERDDGLGDEASMMSTRSAAPTEAMSFVSHANPMQEPSSVPSQRSELPVRHPDSGLEDEEGEAAPDAEDRALSDYLTAYDPDEDCNKSMWDNPVQTPRGTTAPVSEEPSRASFMSLLRDLYSQQEADDVMTPPHQISAQPSSSGVDPNEAAPEQDSRPGTAGLAVATGVKDAEDDVRASRVSSASMDATLAAQEARRQELSAYMAGLQSKLDEEGHKLVELPKNYEVLVEQLLMARRAEYASLAGWLGPRKFADLPINNLPDDHEDPKVSEGLARIKVLDARLAEKEAEAIILARERDPEKWAVAERARLARQAQAVEEALKRERMRRMRNAKLARALTPSESVQGDDLRASASALSVASSRQGASHRMFVLRPEEEALVEDILKRDDSQLEANPFELLGSASLPPDTGTDDAWGSRPGSALSPSGLGAQVSEGVVLAPLALSTPIGGLQGEASAAQLLRMAHQVAAGLAAQSSGLVAEPSEASARPGSACAPSSATASRRTTGDGGGVDLAAGLAVHTRALLRAQQAAVAGMPLAAINAHLEQFVQEHHWKADGTLGDFTSLSTVSVPAQADTHSDRGPSRPVAQPLPHPPPSLQVPTPPASTTSAPGPAPKRDYLREDREAKELASLEADLDQRIRAFKTSDPAGKPLRSEQLAALVAECKALTDRAAAWQQRQSSAGSDAVAPGQVPSSTAAKTPPPAPGGNSSRTAASIPASNASNAAANGSQSPLPTGAAAVAKAAQHGAPGTASATKQGVRGKDLPPAAQRRPTSGSKPTTADSPSPVPLAHVQQSDKQVNTPPSAGRRAAGAPQGTAVSALDINSSSSGAPVTRPASGGTAKAGRRSAGPSTPEPFGAAQVV